MIDYILLLGAAASPSLMEHAGRTESCVVNWVEKLSPAKESASDTVEAAMQACLIERSDLKMALDATPRPGLNKDSASRVAQGSFELNESTVRKRALLHLIKMRAGIAPN